MLGDTCRAQKTTSKSQFSPPTTWVPGPDHLMWQQPPLPFTGPSHQLKKNWPFPLRIMFSIFIHVIPYDNALFILL